MFLFLEVLYVIGLFPDLLPDEIRNNITYPDALPPRMNTEELRSGLQGLACFLAEVNFHLINIKSKYYFIYCVKVRKL